MKYIFLALFIHLSLIVNAQFFGEIYMGFDLKDKSEFHTILKPSKYLINKNTDSPTILSFPSTQLFFGLRYKEKYGMEFGFFKELYFAGTYMKLPDNSICGGASSVDLMNDYYIKLNSRIFKYKMFSIYPEMSFIYGSAKYWDAGIIGINGPQCKGIFIKTYEEKGIDVGLNKYYLFLNADIKTEYRFKKKYSITSSVGYNQGFKTIGQARGYYIYNNEPKQDFLNKTKGDYLYFTIGLKYHYKVDYSQRKTEVESKKVGFLKDNYFHFYIGANSSLDIINDNITVKYKPKIGMSFEIGKNRFALSSTLFYLNRRVRYEDYFFDFSPYDNQHNTSSILNLDVIFEGVELNQALNYYFYHNRKLNLYGGLGYYFLNIKLHRNQYELEHSDGYIKINFDYLRHTYHKNGWLLDIGGVYNLNNKLRLNSCIKVKNMDIYRKITRIAVLERNHKRNPVISLDLKFEYEL